MQYSSYRGMKLILRASLRARRRVWTDESEFLFLLPIIAFLLPRYTFPLHELFRFKPLKSPRQRGNREITRQKAHLGSLHHTESSPRS
jgi:hypothetical protein